MYCPNCGKNQTGTDEIFCRSCGLQLGAAKQLLLASAAAPPRGLSPRAKGILQGVSIIPSAIGLWLILDIFYEGVLGAGMLGGLYAMFTVILLGAIARIAYALAMEEGRPSPARRSVATGNPVDTNDLSGKKIEPAELMMPAGPTDIPPHRVVDSTTRKLTISRDE